MARAAAARTEPARPGDGRDGAGGHRATRTDTVAGTALFSFLLGFVLLVPLPLGSVAPLSWWVIASFVGVLLVVHAASLLHPAAILGQRVAPNWPWVVPFLVATGWAALQASPLTPADWHNPLWQTASGVLATPLAGAITINPDDTRAAIVRLLAYAGIFWLAVQLCWPRRRAEAVFLGLSFAGFAYAAYGLIDKFFGAQMVLWFHKTSYVTSVTSTFINRNNYAAYAGVGLICASGMLIKQLSTVISEQRSRRSAIIALLQAIVGWRGLLVPGWLLSVTALVLTESRGGVISSFAGLLALVAAVAASRTLRRRHALFIAGCVLFAGAIFASLNGAQVAERLAGTDIEQEGRPVVYGLLRRAIGQSPWLGTGYGTFEEAFRPIQKEAVKGRWDRAHNTYLENALRARRAGGAALELVRRCALHSLSHRPAHAAARCDLSRDRDRS